MNNDGGDIYADGSEFRYDCVSKRAADIRKTVSPYTRASLRSREIFIPPFLYRSDSRGYKGAKELSGAYLGQAEARGGKFVVKPRKHRR